MKMYRPVLSLFLIFGVLFLGSFASASTEQSSNPSPPPVPAPFVNESQDPQYYVERYNSETSYKEWFDNNFTEYDSIYHAVGLDEPVVSDISESTQESEIQADPEQHRILGIVDGIQTYQNTKHGFVIEYPSSLLGIIDDSLASKKIVYGSYEINPLAEFSAYPPFTTIKVGYYQNPSALPLDDDDKYLEELQQALTQLNQFDLLPAEQGEKQLALSQVTEIDGHKAYQVMSVSSTPLADSNNAQTNKMLFLTDIVRGDNVFSIIVSNVVLPPELVSDEVSFFSSPHSNESLIELVDSFRFTDEKIPVRYINSDVGLEMHLPDTWTVMDYSFLSNSYDLLKDSDMQQYVHESFAHLISSVKIFPDNPSHLPLGEQFSIDIGNKSDMFDTQSPSDFLVAYQETLYGDIEKYDSSFSCTIESPVLQEINQMQSYRGTVDCNISDHEGDPPVTHHLFLTEKHFVLLTLFNTDKEGEENAEYQKARDSIVQSLDIKKAISLDGTSEAVVTTADNKPIAEPDPIAEPEPENGGGCLIATAAYGTELAPQVQLLREIRDNTIMSTSSGSAFMTGFNSLYYSFSPYIADMERDNPLFQETVRVFITPMISTLSIMTLAESGNDMEVLWLGISVISLNLGMYVTSPIVVGFTIHKYIKSRNSIL